jgi:hypothetical protein
MNPKQHKHLTLPHLYHCCFYFSHGVRLSPLGIVATVRPIVYQPRMIDDDCGAISGTRIGRGTEVLVENLPQHHFVHHNRTRPDQGSNPGRRRVCATSWHRLSIRSGT